MTNSCDLKCKLLKNPPYSYLYIECQKLCKDEKPVNAAWHDYPKESTLSTNPQS